MRLLSSFEGAVLSLLSFQSQKQDGKSHNSRKYIAQYTPLLTASRSLIINILKDFPKKARFRGLRPKSTPRRHRCSRQGMQELFIYFAYHDRVMPTGLKSTSSPIQISARAVEAVAGTLAETEIQLSLNPLDNEVFVVTQVNLDADAPDSVAATSTRVQASLSTTTRATVGTIADQNVIAAADRQIICNSGMTPDGGIPFDREDPTFTALSEDYIGIIATDNAFLQVVSTGGGNVKNARVRIYGYRAKASASVYAALVQSEVLSA